MRKVFIIIMLLMVSAAAGDKFDAVKMKGVKVDLLSEYDVIKPGQKFTVAVSIKHYNGFHTYWLNPGIVGFPTQIKWKLPEGFAAGEVQWQAPEKVKMLKYDCHGYNGDTMLLATIQAPDKLPDEFVISANIAGMSCSKKTCCSIGFADINVKMKSGSVESKNRESKKAIAAARENLPVQLKGWTGTLSKSGDKAMVVKITGKVKSGDYYFYPHQNIYDTEKPQKISLGNDALTINFELNKYVPENLKKVTGLVFSEKGWGNTGRKYLPVSFELK